jgi:hypothetical protein
LQIFQNISRNFNQLVDKAAKSEFIGAFEKAQTAVKEKLTTKLHVVIQNAFRIEPIKKIDEHNEIIILYLDNKTSFSLLIKSFKKIEVQCENNNTKSFLILEVDVENYNKIIKHTELLDNSILLDASIASDQLILESYLKQFLDTEQPETNELVRYSSNLLLTINLVLSFCNKNQLKIERVERSFTAIDKTCTLSIKLYYESSIISLDENFYTRLSFFLGESVKIIPRKNHIEFNVKLIDLDNFYKDWGKFKEFTLIYNSQLADIKRLLGLTNASLELIINEQDKNQCQLVLQSDELKSASIQQFLIEIKYERHLKDNKLCFNSFAVFLTFIAKITESTIKSEELEKKFEHIIQGCQSGPDLEVELCKTISPELELPLKEHDLTVKLCENNGNSTLISHKEDESNYFFRFELGGIRNFTALQNFFYSFNKQEYFPSKEIISLSSASESNYITFENYPTNLNLFSINLNFIYATQISGVIRANLQLEAKAIYFENRAYIITDIILDTYNPNSWQNKHYKYKFCFELCDISPYKDVITILISNQNDYRLGIIPACDKAPLEYNSLLQQFLIIVENFEAIYETICSALPNELHLRQNIGIYMIKVELSYSQNKQGNLLEFSLGSTLDLASNRFIGALRPVGIDNPLFEVQGEKIKIWLALLNDKVKVQELNEQINRSLQTVIEEIPEDIIPQDERKKTVKEKNFFTFNLQGKFDAVKNTLSGLKERLNTVKNKFSNFGGNFKNKIFLASFIGAGIVVLSIFCLLVSLINKLPSPFNAIVGTFIAVAGGAVCIGICYKSSGNSQGECQQL